MREDPARHQIVEEHPHDATSANPSHAIHTPVLRCKRILADRTA
jgi:hypothetical protein